MNGSTDRLSVILIGSAFFLAGLEFSILCIFVPLYIHSVSGSIFTVSLVFSLSSLTVFIGQNIFGFLYDRTGRFWYYIALSAAAFGAAMTLLPRVGTQSGIIVLLTVTSLFQTALFPASEAFLTIIYPRSKGKILGKLFAFDSIGWTIGSLLGAFIRSNVVDKAQAFLIIFYSGAAVAGLVFTAAVLYGSATKHDTSRGNDEIQREAIPVSTRWKKLGRDIRLLYANRQIRRICLIFLLLDGAMAAFFHLFSVYFTEHLGGSWTMVGLCMGMAGLAGAVAFPFLGRLADRFGNKPLMYYIIIGNLFMFAAFLTVRSPVLLAIIYTLPLYPAVRLASRGYMADLTPESTRGGGMGLIGGIQSLASGVAPIVAGALANRYGFEALPWTSLGILLAGVFCTICFLDR